MLIGSSILSEIIIRTAINKIVSVIKKKEIIMAKQAITLPMLDCGLCGFRTCGEMSARLVTEPELINRCIHLSSDRYRRMAAAELRLHAAPARKPTGIFGMKSNQLG